MLLPQLAKPPQTPVLSMPAALLVLGLWIRPAARLTSSERQTRYTRLLLGFDDD